MKFKQLDKSATHDEHERFVLHIGRDETKILIALLEQAKIHTPRISETDQILGRIRQMQREFKRVLSIK